ncbi:hypothetical protein [Sandaracinus amylolyticus]|uniref:Outer membrane protein beta-barrel domain-containing protein n=1 Tax=Sandaracinus amylolyticus TaxID=927083 RepID=A0A0F6YLY5_9BACT|nr:hypothetical protein [Sandaracinus amylolyticus]AKF10735.1 hypothetical protein DB32_007884 [Sandaracinus amylolyticus]
MERHLATKGSRGNTRRSVRHAATIALAMLASALVPASGARAQQYYEPLPEGYYTDDRVRFAVDGLLGGMAGAEGGVGGGVSVHVGLQLNDIVATYAVHRLWLADLVASDRGTFAVSTNSVVIDLTLFEHVQFGAGPSLDVGIGGLCGQDARRCDGLGDLHLGLEARLAVVLGERTRARRRGLVISANVHPIFIDRNVTVVIMGLAVGYQMY